MSKLRSRVVKLEARSKTTEVIMVTVTFGSGKKETLSFEEVFDRIQKQMCFYIVYGENVHDQVIHEWMTVPYSAEIIHVEGDSTELLNSMVTKRDNIGDGVIFYEYGEQHPDFGF